MTGTTTITQHKKSRSAKHAQLMGGNMSESINEVSRPLLTPDECSRLQAAEKTADGKITKAGDMLTFVAGYPPYLGKQHLYFFSKDLLERAKIPAPAPLRRQDPLKP
jgi:type IV secretion system protein VirD4